VSGILAHAGAADIFLASLLYPRIHPLCIATPLCSISVLGTLESTDMNSWSLSIRTDASDTRTIQTTEMIALSEKRVSHNFCIGRYQTRGLLEGIR
jgi:hypothetical protein